MASAASAVDAVAGVHQLAVDLAAQGGLGQAGADGGGHLGHRHGAGKLSPGTVRQRDLDHGVTPEGMKKARGCRAWFRRKGNDSAAGVDLGERTV
jgi:hypothetical protein